MKELNTQKVALTFGLLIGGGHVVWSVLVLLGFAQMLLDFVFWVHMISVPVRVTGFTISQSGILVVVTFIVGYAVGWIFAWLWKQINKK